LSPTASPGSESAVRALEDYYRSANSVARGGDIDAHQLLYSQSCEACVGATSDFTTARRDGLRADSDRFEAWVVEVQDETDRQILLTSTIEFAAVNLVDGNRKVVDSVPAWGGATFAWTLREQPDGTWLIVQGKLLS
jgi:hypothetical protein